MNFFNKLKIPKSYHLVDTPKKLSWMYNTLLKTPYMAYDIETTHPTVKSKDKKQDYVSGTPVRVAGVAFSWGRTSVSTPWEPGTGAYLPLIRMDESPFWRSNQKNVDKALKGILESPVAKVAHNGKFDSRELLRKKGIEVQNFKFDTMLAHALLDEERRECSHALKSDFAPDGKVTKLGMADKYLDLGASAFKEDLQDALVHFDPDLKRYHKVPLEVLYPYACADADLTLSLMFIMRPRLIEEKTYWVFNNISLPLSDALVRMESKGMPLNIQKAREVESNMLRDMKSLEAEIWELTGQEFKVSSNPQLGKVLFEDLQLPGGRRNKHGWVVDDSVLKELEHPVKEPLSKYRRAQQIQSTYASPAIVKVDEVSDGGKVGWVHPSVFMDSLTGRLKGSDPNLMNLPRKENGGKIVKGMWECPDDYVFIFSDFSQMELRVAAHVSQEPVWIDSFNRGEDMHSATAKSVFKLDCDVAEVPSHLRSRAKTINFGIIYGESVWSLSKSLDMEIEEAEKLVNVDYFGNAPVLKEWIDYIHSFVQENGYVVNMFGRRRHLPTAQLQVPHYRSMPKYNDRPECYKFCIKPMDIGLSQNDAYEVDLDSLKRMIKSSGKPHYFKCADCQYLGSCFPNSETRYIDQTKKHALRQSVNTIVQGSASDMAALSLIKIDEQIRKEKLRSAVGNIVHDEICCITHKDEVERVGQIMQYYMTDWLRDFTGFSVPLIADLEVHKCWGDK